MIERTSIFTFRDETNYNLLTEATFNWQKWIEEESLRRYVSAEVYGLRLIMTIDLLALFSVKIWVVAFSKVAFP